MIETPAAPAAPRVDVHPEASHAPVAPRVAGQTHTPEFVRQSLAASIRHTLNLREVEWSVAVPIVLMHVAVLLAPFFFSWSGLAVAVALWWACGGLGICLCYHRLLCHRSFKTYKPIEYALVTLGTLNWQGSPIVWVGHHRIHHKHSDGPGDPHSPHHGFNWAHILWCMKKADDRDNPRNAARDLQRDAVIRALDRFHWLPQFVLAGVLFVAGHFLFNAGISWMIWGIAVRTVFTYHATWFVNSASHTWGYRNYETTDDSRNNWWVAILSFGEGWHNNHHHAQRSAAHGHKWYEIDLTHLTIKAMEKLRLAYDVVPKPA